MKWHSHHAKCLNYAVATNIIAATLIHHTESRGEGAWCVYRVQDQAAAPGFASRLLRVVGFSQQKNIVKG